MNLLCSTLRVPPVLTGCLLTQVACFDLLPNAWQNTDNSTAGGNALTTRRSSPSKFTFGRFLRWQQSILHPQIFNSSFIKAINQTKEQPKGDNHENC
jgi:hypothetical protein